MSRRGGIAILALVCFALAGCGDPPGDSESEIGLMIDAAASAAPVPSLMTALFSTLNVNANACPSPLESLYRGSPTAMAEKAVDQPSEKASLGSRRAVMV